MRPTRNKKTRSAAGPLSEKLFAGLPTELPDLNSLFDDAAEFDHVAIRDRFAAETFARTVRRQTVRRTTFDERRVKCAAASLAALPEHEESIHLVVGGEFAGFDLLPAFLRLAKAKHFEALHLTTLGFSRENFAQLEVMIAAKEIRPSTLAILCGDFFRRADPGLWDIGKLIARKYRFTFRSYRNHTKLILAQLAGKSYVVEGSANLRSCANIEQFTITQSPALYAFHLTWIRECLAFAKP